MAKHEEKKHSSYEQPEYAASAEQEPAPTEPAPAEKTDKTGKKLYHQMYGEKTAQSDADYDASIRDGWSEKDVRLKPPAQEKKA